jgi:hypothetical protein
MTFCGSKAGESHCFQSHLWHLTGMATGRAPLQMMTRVWHGIVKLYSKLRVL